MTALFKSYETDPQIWRVTKLARDSTACCAGCYQSKATMVRLCIIVTEKYIPKNCNIQTDRKFYFCAIPKCIRLGHLDLV